jgi:CRISPR-associated protein Csb2
VHAWFISRFDGTEHMAWEKFQAFDTVTYIRSTTTAARSYAKFELPDGAALRQEDVAKIGSMLRSLAFRAAENDDHEFPGGAETYVMGRHAKADKSPQKFSYMPLPTIGHEHADGMIRRILVVEPYGGDGSHARWAQWRMCHGELKDADCTVAELTDTWRPNSGTMIHRYVREATTWCTVTPVVLPGFDDGEYSRAEILLLKALQHAGIRRDALTNVILRKPPFWPGSLHARRYVVPRYLGNLPIWHAYLQFSDPVMGPLAVGAGRHIGLGTFAAW